MLILAIDSGNSFIKWGLHDGTQWLKKGKVHYLDVTSLSSYFVELSKPTKIVVSHVGNTVTRSRIAQAIDSVFSFEPYWIISQRNGFGITNQYSDPSQLGSDRWTALIAAWKKSNHQACLVANIGTAMTIDALSNRGEFLGGVIAPGSHLMLESLFSGTQLDNRKQGCYERFPLNTSDAIQSGIIHCLIGAIERMHHLLTSRSEDPEIKCVISGGGANILVPHIKLPMLEVDELVLEGLAIIGNNN